MRLPTDPLYWAEIRPPYAGADVATGCAMPGAPLDVQRRQIIRFSQALTARDEWHDGMLAAARIAPDPWVFIAAANGESEDDNDAIDDADIGSGFFEQIRGR